MKSIDADIKEGKFKNIYFLMGVEPYLIRLYRDKLVNALVGSDDELNCRYYDGPVSDMGEVIEYADTVPFFAPRRVIVMENTGLFKSSDDKLASYLKDMPETTFMIFTECFRGERRDERKYESALVDKRYKMYKTVHDLGRIIEFKRLQEADLINWLLRRFADSGLKVTRRAMDCILEYVGDDMTRLVNESEKLICYRAGHSSVDEDDVKEICSRNIDNDIFEMVGAIAAKNRRKALKLYYDLIELKVRSMNILALISREFNLLMQVKILKNSGRDKDDISKLTRINPFFVGKYISVSGRFTSEYLREAVEECVETETAAKQGLIDDMIAVEMLIIKYSS